MEPPVPAPAADAKVSPTPAPTPLPAPMDARPSPAAMPRNVLFITIDDLNRDVSPYGHPIVRTPNLDRLAKRAVRFDNAYAQYPLCNPSRASFLTGRRPEELGVYDNETAPRGRAADAVFLPEHLRAHGYHTARVGKIFHMGRDQASCWDQSEEGTPGNKVIYQPRELTDLGLTDKVIASESNEGATSGERAEWAIVDAPDEAFIDHQVARRGAQLLGDLAKNTKPFFLALGFRRPHLPWIAPKKYFDLYPVAKIPDPLPSPVRWDWAPKDKPPLENERYKKAVAAYYASVSFMDAQLGLVLDAMDRQDRWKDTVVVVFGDHGYHLGERNWWGKQTPYHVANAVPLFIAAPGFAANKASAGGVELLDLFPTVTHLLGVKPPARLAGRSLVPLLSEPATAWQRPSFSVQSADGQIRWVGVTLAPFRLVQRGSNGPELYDLRSDPREYDNLAARPENASTLQSLKDALRQYRAAP